MNHLAPQKNRSSQWLQVPLNEQSTPRDVAFGELHDQELRVDPAEGAAKSTDAQKAEQLINTIQTQIASLDAQRRRLAELLAVLPTLPD